MKIQSDLEFGGKQDMSDVLETLISNCDSLQCHIEYEYQIPAALKKLEEIKQKEPDIYKKIVVNNFSQLYLHGARQGKVKIETAHNNTLKIKKPKCGGFVSLLIMKTQLQLSYS